MRKNAYIFFREKCKIIALNLKKIRFKLKQMETKTYYFKTKHFWGLKFP